MSSTATFNRRDSLKSLAALGAAGTLGAAARWRLRAEADHRRRDLRRPARRLRLQPGAGRGRGRAQEDARREGGRRRERARDRGRAEDHDRHDRAGRRHAGVPHLLRLLRSAHAGAGAEVSRRALRPLRRHVDRGQAPEEHGQLLRLHRRVPVPQRRDRRPHEQEQQDRLHRRQADPAGAAQHQRLHHGRALGQARHHHAA